MTPKSTPLSDELYAYLLERGVREDDALAAIREETAAMGDVAVMQIAPDQGAFMTLLARLTGARRALELGTFTGYSAVCVARGLADGGRLTACELKPEYAEIAARNFERAGVAERIEIRVGPASATLEALAAEGSEFDLAFIDADKGAYPEYFESSLSLLRTGGLIVIDNVLMGGRVLEPADENATVVDRLNADLAADERIDISMVPIADGLTLARKR